MGIDVFLRWDGQTEAEQKAQYTGFNPEAGAVGYLREAYHGGPYGTRVLCTEGFDEELADDDGAVRIPAAILRARLPAALAALKECRLPGRRREKTGRIVDIPRAFPVDEPILRSFEAFVALAEEKEAAGLNPRIVVSY